MAIKRENHLFIAIISKCTSPFLFFCQSVCPSVGLSVSRSVRQSVCPSVGLSISRSVKLLLLAHTHFPWIEADWINNCWLSNLFSRKYSPCDSNRGKPVCIGHINWALKHSQHKWINAWLLKIFVVLKKNHPFLQDIIQFSNQMNAHVPLGLVLN